MAKMGLTVDSLKKYVPIFQASDGADDLIKADEELSDAELVRLFSLRGLKQQTIDEVARLSDPLIKRELTKLLKTSHLVRETDDLFGVIYYAGIGGMEKGLRKFEVDKIDKSATNYLFQWIVTYAKKELLSQEAEPLGIAPSRFQRYKKISAVRKRLSDNLDRSPTNEEILEYFHSGQAELKRLDGPKLKKEGVSNANASITIELIEEQQEVEKNLQFAQFFSDDEEFRLGGLLAQVDKVNFAESLFGTFIQGRNFNNTAVAVLKSELQYDLNKEENEIMNNLSKVKYREYRNTWINYLGTPMGDFQQFATASSNLEFDDIDLSSVAGLLNNYQKSKPRRVSILFNKGKSS